ncbi:MAG: hypothetical protein EOP10_18780 [Proteobacteria bacterium]|nr:MAG: hypothetical protein EOP10_18780 [Pseudomonadota bacterium]
MRSLLPVVRNQSLFLSLLLIGCGGDKVADYRTAKASNTLEAVAEKPNAVLVNFKLPDRSKDPTLSQVNGYYFRLVGEGSDCPAGELIEDVGAFDDQKREFEFKVNGKCTYVVVMKLGVYQAPALTLTSTLNYETDIKPLIESNCVSCHETYASYTELVENGEMILREVESKAMPKTAPLSDADIAKFLAWKDGGYIEKSTTPPPTAKELLLTSVYYQNNRNDYLMAYELLTRLSFELRRSLWIQPAAVEAGLTVKELSTFGDN